MKIILLLLVSVGLFPSLGTRAIAQATQGIPSAKAAKESPSKVTRIQQENATQNSLPQVPVVSLEFKLQGVIPGIQGSQAFVSPILCSPQGVAFVAFIEPSDFGPQAIYSLDPKGGRAFSVKSIPGLYDINFLHGYFASDSMVGILVNATKDDKQASNTIPLGPDIPPKHVFTGKHHDYLIKFDSRGNFQKAIELPERFNFRRMTALSDDTFLGLAYDRTNSVPQLFLMDSDAKIVRTLELPNSMKSDPEIVAGQSGDSSNEIPAESSLSWWLFAPSRGRILLYQAHSESPVLEVGANGVVREVTIASPPGYKLDEVIPANDRWIMRFRKESPSDSGAADARPDAQNDAYVLYEVDPADGHLKRRIEVSTGPFYSISCEQDGIFNAFSIDGQKLNLLTADLPR